ncbi:response regulator [Paenibacillus eucommiae]|uniref:Two-component SAPR family response regulator n=1 Tax=Paenibacillus eucommiae TaxID=1355755 RepID=A0ABS4IV37_9BACL|nr:response regulator [Paenibacillus eucommiae]MBP1990955.1 two-component SAPR family response regulator [Paenibacillus eucommiae]
MRVILVDDERLALLQLTKMLEKMGGIDVVGTYLNPIEAIEWIGELRPDAVFLDIHMPGIDGLKMAVQIQENCPAIQIVFVTAFDQYAVQAFDLNALDYVMKPLHMDRLGRAVQRLQDRVRGDVNVTVSSSPQSVLIRCLKTLQFEMPGQKSERLKWRTSKAQELFVYLLHHRGRVIARDELLELLWPDFEERRAAAQLYTTIYQIRQSLQRNEVGSVTINSGSLTDGYSLDTSTVRIDTEEWEHQLKQLDSPEQHTIDKHESLFNQYTGDYLSDYDYLWAEHERERLRRLWLHHAQNMIRFYTRQGMHSEAIRINLKIQQLNPVFEESYFSLMKLYDLSHHNAAVEEQYMLLTETLKRELDSRPDDRVAQWYQGWKSEGLVYNR